MTPVIKGSNNRKDGREQKLTLARLLARVRFILEPSSVAA